jgi:hypothetical protein
VTVIKHFLKKIIRSESGVSAQLAERWKAANLFKEFILPTLQISDWKDLHGLRIKGILVGSDETLNPSKHTTQLMRGILPQHFDIPVSGYAMSLGGRDRIQSCLATGFNAYGFRYVGIRDSESECLFRQAGRSPYMTLDPVFLPDESLLDRLNASLLRNEKIENVINEPYILVYSDMHAKVLCPLLMPLLNNDIRIVILGNLEEPHKRDKRADEAIFTFLDVDFPIHRIPGLFSSAKGVVSSFYHGIILSLRYEKPFYFLRNSMKEYKVMDLLTQLRQDSLPDGDTGILEDTASWELFYKQVSPIILEQKERSLAFLKQITEDM